MTPRTRIFRTIIQVVLAELAAFPTAIAGLGFSAATTAKIGGLVGFLTVVATVLHNVLGPNQ